MMKQVYILIGVLVLFAGCRPGPTNTPRLCINNLSMIQAGKQQWAEQTEQPSNALPTPENISPFIKGGFAECKCPREGKYIIHPLGQESECTLHGTVSIFRKD
jgi:hypothetical protein